MPKDTVSQPRRWREFVTLHLAMTWGLAASIPPFCGTLLSRRVWENITRELERSARWGENADFR